MPILMPSLPAATAVGGGPSSPCTGICQLDGNQICLGCRRTVAEIAAWPEWSHAQRQACLQALTQRPVGP